MLEADIVRLIGPLFLICLLVVFRLRKRKAARLLMVTGVLHILGGLWVGRRPLMRIFREEFFGQADSAVGTVPAHAEKELLFWFLLWGVFTFLLGQVISQLYKEGKLIPAYIGWELAVITFVAALLAPINGFWLMLIPAFILIKDAKAKVLLCIALTLFAFPCIYAQQHYTRTVAHYDVPSVTLISMDGTKTSLASALKHDGPVMLQFIFTTCPTVCPVMSSLLSAAQSKLGTVRLISISIDPEQDTPERLREYARKFKAGPQWLFLTGSTENITAIQKAFDAYRGSKMRHEPLTFLRATPGDQWVRLEGLMNATQLVNEYKLLMSPQRVEPDPELGKRIYREGLLPSGKPVRAVVQGDITVEGTQLNCANCHRRSGFGSSEGTALVPPITGAFLFGGRELQRTELFRKLFQEVQPNPQRASLRGPRVRPAYTDETLISALREGKDPWGRELHPLMPRYDLSPTDAAHLIAYLRSIDNAPAPGVTRSAIHFATVVTEGVDPEKRRAMLQVMDAYFRWKNAEVAGLLSRPGHAAFYDSDSYSALREWTLQVWELKGPVETWSKQLDAYYKQQPVFALLSGAGEESWRPVHDFCERNEVPCLFPNTNLPVVSTSGAYSLYLSGGLTVEAEALAKHLLERVKPGARILQVYRDTGGGVVLANALRRSLPGLQDRVIRGSPSPVFWKKLFDDEQVSALVLWLDDADLATLGTVQVSTRPIYLSYSLLKSPPAALADRFGEKIFLTYPFTLPQAQTPHIYRARAWLRSKGVVRMQERVQLNTYFALAVADHSLTNLAGNFSRDYFIETVEHETEVTPNPGVFPRLSLGPGQRFASKGSYIIKLSATGIEPASDWIIP
jgi:cytochrome oxidase Cu insertion factor (SCO1/SenC/PrrC family)